MMKNMLILDTLQHPLQQHKRGQEIAFSMQDRKRICCLLIQPTVQMISHWIESRGIPRLVGYWLPMKQCWSAYKIDNQITMCGAGRMSGSSRSSLSRIYVSTHLPSRRPSERTKRSSVGLPRANCSTWKRSLPQLDPTSRCLRCITWVLEAQTRQQ